jgi:hypothetical protein
MHLPISAWNAIRLVVKHTFVWQKHLLHLTSIFSCVADIALRMTMKRVWTDIPKPNPYSSAPLCPTHEDIHAHGCRSKSKSAGFPSIHEDPWFYVLYTSA